MTALSITAANVRFGTGAKFIPRMKAGEAVTRMQPVYLHTDNKVYKADANASAATAKVIGFAAQDVGADQLVDVLVWDDDLTVGATLAPTPYVLGSTAGDIAPAADLAAGWYITSLLLPKSTTKAIVNILASGLVVPA